MSHCGPRCLTFPGFPPAVDGNLVLRVDCGRLGLADSFEIGESKALDGTRFVGQLRRNG